MRFAITVLLIVLFLLGLVYTGAELYFSALRERSEYSWLEHIMRFTHIVFTLPLLLVPILQFSPRLRSARPGLHRKLGRIYLVSTILAAIGALYLGFNFEQPGRRVPLVLFSLLWIYFGAAAWQTARNRNFFAHSKFVARSYSIALAFVLVRILGQLEPALFAWIPEPEVRGVTREWLAFLVPLLFVEAVMSWIPSMKSHRKLAPT